MAIIEYRNAKAAVETFNMKDKAAAARRLQESPGLAEILARMARAQSGLPLDGADVDLSTEGSLVFEAYHEPSEDEDDADEGEV